MTTPLAQMQHNMIASMLEREKELQSALDESEKLARAYKRRIEEYEDAVDRAKQASTVGEVKRILTHY